METRGSPDLNYTITSTTGVPLALVDVDAKKKKKKKNKKKDQLQVLSTSSTTLPQQPPAKKEITYLTQSSTPGEQGLLP